MAIGQEVGAPFEAGRWSKRRSTLVNCIQVPTAHSTLPISWALVETACNSQLSTCHFDLLSNDTLLYYTLNKGMKRHMMEELAHRR
ncbi:hypothetical protein PDE_07023 [Penicillium oxalicum 114-2]|uniref:Uncharacterized protein n=1 Tax=Penicillium oxalicum (strain 114-2 / CGMCC 5302) TaxID=933388 RepID=S7ZNV2_PENO1|nr:hypothetical protein PDE_07023 [Penicillium oxalicum 114-2]